MGNGSVSTMDMGIVARLQWAMVVAMGDGGCQDWRQQWQQHDFNGQLAQLTVGWQYNCDGDFQNANGGNGRRQWQWHDCDGQQQCNGQWDGSMITMCSIAIAMDGGCANGQWWCGSNGRWLKDNNVMGDGNLAA